MTRIALLAAVLWAALPVPAESQQYTAADDSTAVHLATAAVATSGQGQGTGHAALAGTAGSKQRLKAEELASIISNLQQTRAELQTQIEIQRRQVLKLEEDIGKILTYVEAEGRPQAAAASCQPVTSTKMAPAPDAATSDAQLAVNDGSDQGEGWIRNETTGDTVAMIQGQVILADRDGRPLARPTELLTGVRSQTAVAAVQVGNLDVTFSPKVSRRVQMAFLQYPTAPATSTLSQRFEGYATTSGTRSLGAPPSAKEKPAVSSNGSGEVRKLRLRPQTAITGTTAAPHQAPRLRPPAAVAAAGPGRQHPPLLIAHSRAIPVGIGLPVAIGQDHNGVSIRQAPGFTFRRKAVEAEPVAARKEKVAVLRLPAGAIAPGLPNHHRVEIAAMPHPLGG